MIIDAHTHLGNNTHINVRVKDLLLSMDEARIDKTLVFAGSINGIQTPDLLQEISPHRDRLYPVGAVELSAAAYVSKTSSLYRFEAVESNVRRQLDAGVIAMKFYLGYEHFYPDDELVYAAMRLIAEKNVTAIFHTGDCLNSFRKAKLKYAHPLGIDDVAVDFPDARIVIAHMGYPWHRDAAEVCYKNKNVYADISGFVYGEFNFSSQDQFLEVISDFKKIAGGDEKLLFGTDWPISNQKSYMNMLGQGNIPTQKTFQENIAKAFSL